MEAAALESDRVIGGRYVLRERIGKGGMGEVWRARHKDLKSPVAIKFLHLGSAKTEATHQRFLTEAQVTASLKSRHAVQVFDFGVTDDGLPYLVMELLEGETLDSRIEREGRLPVATTIDLLRQAARALDRAHALGIVHRDFKPENMIIRPDEEGHDEIKVLDFGIAKIIGGLESAYQTDEESSINMRSPLTTFTRTGNMVGTPYYMAPEQVEDATQVGPAADIWAMGVVTFECLTGRRPFDDETVGKLFTRILACQHPSVVGMGVPVPALFDDWFKIICARDPAERFPDAQTAVTALAIALDMPAAAPQPRASRASRADLSGALISPSEAAMRRSGPLAETIDASHALAESGRVKRPEEGVSDPPVTSPSLPDALAAPRPRRAPIAAIAAVLALGAALIGWALLAPRGQPVPTPADTGVAPATTAPAPETSTVAASAPTEATASAATSAASQTSASPPASAEPTASAQARAGKAAAPKTTATPAGSAAPVATAAPTAAPTTAPTAPATPTATAGSPFQLPPLGL